MTTIGDEAFSGCNSITDVYCFAEEVPSTGINCFNKSNIKDATLHVSGTSKEKYRNDAVWGAFGTIVAPSYTLTFIVDGEEYNSFVIEEGTDITIEYQPQKNGYTFTLLDEMPESMPSHDVTVTGTFTRVSLVPSYKRNLSSQTTGFSSIVIGSIVQKSVSFNLSNKGTESINVTELVVKNASNYAVVSRSTDASLLGTLAAGNNIELSVNLTSDITTCYEWHYTYKGQEFVFCSDVNDPAMKHDVTFYVDGQVYVTYEYDLGDEIIPEEEPTKEHYTFSGWSEIPTTMPDKNVAVNGTFIGDKYTLTYIVDEETYKTYDVEYGTAITAEAAPTKEGYTFSGWSEIPATMPANDVTVTGSFTINKYILAYTVDGEEYKSVLVNYGEEIAPESEPTKDGYTFSGWNDIPATMPAKDVTVTGSFVVNSYKLTYMVDGEEYKIVDVAYGTSITAEAAPTKEGYSFSGWSEMPATMPANDITVTGSFTINKYTLAYVVDGENYVTYEVNYGTQIFPLPELTKDGYTFSGWSTIPETMPAHDVTITGTFTFIDAIEGVTAADDEYQIYTIDGKPVETLQKGVNIIRFSNGTTKKAGVK